MKGHSHVTWLTLNRLARTICESLVREVAGRRDVPGEAMYQIVAKTDGVPLFVEELTKTVLESGLLVEDSNQALRLCGPMTPLTIPETLQDSLMARLDRMAPAVKEMAQIGACIGRQFARQLLAAVAPHPPKQLDDALEQLVSSGLVFQRGRGDETMYAFKHALIQDAAYQSLLRSRRRLLHGHILRVLEDRFPTIVELEPELLAHHATHAGDLHKAVHYWHQAGKRAVESSANAEAIAHLTKGLDLLTGLSDDGARQQLELQLRLALGPALIATKGQTAAEVGASYAHALRLSEAIGGDQERFRALFGLWQFHVLRAELAHARALSERCMALARAREDPELIMASCRALGAAQHYLGEFDAAKATLEEGVELADRHPLRSHPYAFLADPRVNCRSYLCRTLWILGYPHQAVRLGEEVLALAEASNHPFTLANNLGLIAGLHLNRRDAARTLELAERLIRLSDQQGFSYWLANGMRWRGWARVSSGQTQDGVADLRESVGHFQMHGNAITLSHALMILADAYRQVGEANEGLEVLAGLPLGDERRHAAEICRLEGELLMMVGRFEQAGDRLERALAVARAQHAKSFELRAAMGLARLRSGPDKDEQARAHLSEVYSWFSEGLDTADLREAKLLLDALG